MAEAGPPKTFDPHGAKTCLSRLADRARAGGEIGVAEAGVAYAKLVPVGRGAFDERLSEEALEGREGERLERGGL